MDARLKIWLRDEIANFDENCCEEPDPEKLLIAKRYGYTSYDELIAALKSLIE